MWQPNEVDLAAVDKWSMKDISPPDDTVVEAEVGNMYISPYPSLMRSSEITKENLRVGDVIVSNWKGLGAKVLEILDHSFAVSNFGTTEHDWRFGFEWIRFSDARDSGYKIEIIKE